ncbi:hypothetical protein EDB83DRAFT_2236063 [Lactarius deliciosus]|nr:hypothetical protein EDB83DRAFT_2236063 [Lactarius deliciosus]
MGGPVARQRRPKTQRKATLMSILRDLQGLKLTAVDLLTAIINGNGKFEGFRNAFFSPKNHNSLIGLLDQLIQDDKGRPIVEGWMFPHVLRLVCKEVHVEMEAAKPHLWMYTANISPEFIKNWDIHQIMGPVTTPTLRSVLEAAVESKVSLAKSKSAKSKNRFTALLITMAQIHFLRSRNSAKVQIGLGLQAWACGTLRQMIDVLHQTGLTVSYNSISSLVLKLADRSIERAKAASLLPHALAYDNINISSSIYVEQGPNAMSKVQSGTFTVIYKLLNAQAEDMDMRPLIKNLRRSSPLVISDLRMTLAAGQSYISQMAVTIVRILTKYVKGFETQQSDPMLQHPPRRPLPIGHKTVFHPLWASTIEEASIDGNLLVHDDVYLIRRKDVSYWETRKIFQLGFGSFHLTMNLLWCVLETHRGMLNQMGSLTQFFAVLEKTRLGGEHPDYHMLLAALTQILHGLILNAWRNECDYSSLRDFAKAEPTPGGLLDCARRIAEKYASDPVSGVESTKPVVDVVRRNVALLTRDLLLVVELVDAIATGDFGRIEDILPTLACMFRGSGSNNYSMEILHLIFNIKEVWTPTFAYVFLLCHSRVLTPACVIKAILCMTTCW